MVYDKYDSYDQPTERCTLKRIGSNCTFFEIRLNKDDSIFYSNYYRKNISECLDNIIFINVLHPKT